MRPLKIIMVGSQDEIFEELPPENIELYVVQPQALIGPHLQAAAREIYAIEAFNDEQVLKAARYFVGKYAIDALFCFTEYGLLPAAHAAETLGLPGIDAKVTELCRNKWKLREKLAATSLHVPFVMAESREAVSRFAAENGLPLVLKDPGGVGSINVSVCHHLDDALRFFSALMQQGYTRVLVEKYLTGTEYSVETLSIRGQHQLIGVTDKRLQAGGLIEQSHVYPAAIGQADRERIERYISDLLTQIGHRHGPMHIEIKVEHDRIALIEVNNRPGGDYIWDMVNKVSGVNLVAETLRYAMEGHPCPQQRNARRRYGAMSYVALFKPQAPALIRSALAGVTTLDRVQCSELSLAAESKVSNSFERPGFILIGDKDSATLNVALPIIERWIARQHQ